jgi:hypothetical protein
VRLTRFLMLVLLFLPTLALAQETTGRLEGRLVDATGDPVVAASVVVSGHSLQGNRGAESGGDGRFVLLALPVGEYTVRISSPAYQTHVIDHTRVLLGEVTDLGVVKLLRQVHEVPEVVVAGRATLIDPSSTAFGGDLRAPTYQALPVERDYKTVATLLPHVNASPLGDAPNYAGGTGLENRYFVDGIDVTDPFRGATATRLPYNFIQELQVKSGGYQAEYRSSLGGTLNAVTYSGGNAVRGQVFGFYTSNGFSRTPRSVPGAPSADMTYSLYDVGFGIGGPIRKDRLWYYAAYNPSRSTEDVDIPGFGSHQDHTTTHSFAGKLTWRANETNTLVLTAVGDPTTGRQVSPPTIQPGNVDPFLFSVTQGGVGAILEGRHLLSRNLLLETSLSHLSRNDESTPETERGRTEPFFVDSLGVPSGGGSRGRNDSHVTMASVHTTWIGNGQEFKAGVEYRTTGLDFDTRYDIILQTSATLYYYQTASFNGHVSSRSPSVFAEHIWRPTPRLTVNDGLRWDGQYWISSEGKVAQTILDQWQPRLGLTYQTGRLGTQKAYATFGRFYQDLTTAPLFWYYNLDSHYFAANYDHDPRLDPSGADTVAASGGYIQPKIVGLQGQYFDEFTVGYERQVGPRASFSVRGIQRILRQGIEDGIDPSTFAIGLSNPGLGALSQFPEMTRRYSALEFSYQGQAGENLSLLASYVLSRTRGNYEGLFDSRLGNPYPNATGLYDVVDQLVNATGLLPNDHTHVLKLAASRRIGSKVTVGAVGIVESGMPVSELGGASIGPPYYRFIGARGSHGRTPTLWDLNLRVGYALPHGSGQRFIPKLTLDFFHVASARSALRYDEVHYRALDSSGNEIDPNPSYRTALAYQPPMKVRLGMEASF